MIVIEFIYTIFYILLIIVVILLAIALVIPLAILFGIYWLLFKSWRTKPKRDIAIKKNPNINSKSVKDIIKKSLSLKNAESEDEREELEKEIEDLAKEIKDSVQDIKEE